MMIRFPRALLFATIYTIICPSHWWISLFVSTSASVNVPGFEGATWLFWVFWGAMAFPFGLLLKSERDKFRWWTVILIATIVYVAYSVFVSWYYPRLDLPDDLKMSARESHFLSWLGAGLLWLPIAILCVWPAVWLSGQPFVIYKRYKATGRWMTD